MLEWRRGNLVEFDVELFALAGEVLLQLANADRDRFGDGTRGRGSLLGGQVDVRDHALAALDSPDAHR